ncbi:MAG: class I adenylate-forming enzyme family protein [Stellaceae bacterium]
MNLIQPILNHAKTRPHAPALIEGDRETVYAELADLILRTAAQLAGLGAREGDRIGLWLGDGGEHVVALLAVASIGAIAAPLNWRAPATQIANLARALSLKLALVQEGAVHTLECPAVPVDERWRREVAEHAPSSSIPQDWHAPFVIAATSGSTGAPKFTLATHLQYYCGVVGFAEMLELSGRHRYFSTMPLYFSGGRLGFLTHLLRGDCVLLYGSLVDGADYAEGATKLEATVGFVVPSLIRGLISIAGDEPLLPGLKRLTSVGASLFPDEKRATHHRVSRYFCDMYGTTETNPISLLRSSDIESRADSVGQPNSLAEVQVVDEHSQALPAGAAGLLRVRGPALASPLALPDQPTHPGFRDGWYYPGEIACVDDEGFIVLTGRASDVIIRHGAKIYPAEVEAALQQHPDVLECAVVGHRGAHNEEEIVAFVVGRRSLDLAPMVAHCRTYLEAAKRPQHIWLVETLPRSTSGKVDKQALARLLTRAS